jgi:ABC-type transport system involved in cytochrome c biogenesis permease subunit
MDTVSEQFSRHHGATRITTSLAIAAILGTIAVVGPAYFYPRQVAEHTALLPIMLRAVKGMQMFVVIPLLFATGFIASRIAPIHPVIIGLTSVFVLPLWSILDLFLGDPSVERHNLLPIEWFFYLVLAGVAAVGATTQRSRSKPG